MAAESMAPTVAELTPDVVRELLRWRPTHGVFSLYVDAGLIDRDGRWRLELRSGLNRAVRAADGADRERRLAIQETVRRVEQALLGQPLGSEGRGLAAFIEVAREPGEERWYASQLAPPKTEARYGERPQVGPLLAILDDGAPLGIAAMSGERVRLLDWRLGRVAQLHDWELDLLTLDWREQRAPRPTDPASESAVTASGRDQYDRRLEASRERFAHQAGVLARVSAGSRLWRQILVFGDERYVEPFADGFGDRCELRHVDSSDLATQPTHLIAERVERLLPALNRERESELIERISEARFADARSALGAQATLTALEQGRVEHLAYDAAISAEEVEPMIELALSTGAAVTPVEGESATALERHGGTVALLRY